MDMVLSLLIGVGTGVGLFIGYSVREFLFKKKNNPNNFSVKEILLEIKNSLQNTAEDIRDLRNADKETEKILNRMEIHLSKILERLPKRDGD